MDSGVFAAGESRNGYALTSPLNGRLFVLVGAGGAGRALAFGAKSRGARVIIFDIDFGMYNLFPQFVASVYQNEVSGMVASVH